MKLKRILRIIAGCSLAICFYFWPANISALAVTPNPVLTRPADAISLPRDTIRFDWEDVDQATGYGIELCSQNPTDNPNGNTASAYRITAALCPDGLSEYPGDTSYLAPGTYYWRTIAVKNNELYGGFSDARSFTVPAWPKPDLAGPSDGAQVLLGPVDFSWDPVDGATNYAIELCSANPGDVGNANPAASRIGAAIVLAENGHVYPGDTSGLTFGQTYWWRTIAVKNGQLFGVFSAPRSFTLISLRPTLIAPNDAATVFWGLLEFRWGFSPGSFGAATGYAIELLSNPPAAHERNTRAPSQYRIAAAVASNDDGVTSFMGNTTGMTGVFWWRTIAVKNGQLYGEFSDAYVFTTYSGSVRPTDFLWPAGDRSFITSYYGYRSHPIYGDVRFHYGLDIGVDEGTPLRAPAAGTIIKEYWSDSVGNVLEIDHGGGIATRFCHLSSNSVVPVGASVARGQTIGFTGGTGSLSTGPHLHFEVYDYAYSNNDLVPPNYAYQRAYTVDPLSLLP